MYHHQIVNFKLGGVMVLIRTAPVDQAGFTLCLSFPPPKKNGTTSCPKHHLAAALLAIWLLSTTQFCPYRWPKLQWLASTDP
jgi:hypothetical protein